MKIDSNRYRNALRGLAIGDAWGYQVEFSQYKRMPKPVPQPKNEWIVSDDTQMTLALQDAVLECEESGLFPVKHFYPIEEIILDHFVKWAESPLNNRAPGATCMGSINALKHSSKSWSEVARHSAGCGAVMRLLPTIALEESQWQAMTAIQAVITHNDPMAVASALLLGDVGRAIAREEAEDGPMEFALSVIDAMDRGVYDYNELLSTALRDVTRDMPSYLMKGVDGGLRKAVLRADIRTGDASRYQEDVCKNVGEGWDAATAVALAILVADGYLTGDLTVREAMEWAVTSNGDSDSIGAIAGMLIGLSSNNPDFWTKAGIEPVFEDEYKEQLD